MRKVWLILSCIVLLTGCSKAAGGGNTASSTGTGAGSPANDSALLQLHAKPDPTILAEVKSQVQQAALVSINRNNGALSPGQLPSVSQALFAPPADQVSRGSERTSSITTADNTGSSIWPFNAPARTADNHGEDQPARVASYAPYAGSSSTREVSSGGASLVPPPPAVVLSTQAQPVSYAAPIDVYGNPYYGGASTDTPSAHAPGSLFGMGAIRSGAGSRSDNNVDAAGERKHIDFVAITPTGMDSRSPYKQRDDLKLLWKGALSTSSLQALAQRERRVSQQLSAITTGLPSESTRGSLNVSQHQVDMIFKTPVIDRRILPEIKKAQADLAQDYYRYLYAYNKYALAQQTVAARKQELDYADDAAEKQRATADWSAAKADADSATDDMKSAQCELAGAAGAQAARLIIGRVSGIAPSADSLAQAVDSAGSTETTSGRHHLLGSLFHSSSPAPDSTVTTKASSSASSTASGTSPHKKTNDKSAKSHGSKESASAKAAHTIHGPAMAKDLSPAPSSSSDASSASASSSPAPTGASEVASAGYADSNSDAVDKTLSGSFCRSATGVSFVLKGVSVTPRKSILRVAIRNNGNDYFSFDPDAVGVREGINKLSEAMVRADFDTTKLGPDQEVLGTITIFGRPWNDRLSVCLAQGSKVIQLRR